MNIRFQVELGDIDQKLIILDGTSQFLLQIRIIWKKYETIAAKSISKLRLAEHMSGLYLTFENSWLFSVIVKYQL